MIEIQIDIYKQISYKELAHEIMDMDNSKICRVSQAGGPGEPVV